MTARHRILPLLTLAAVMAGLSASRAAAKEIPAEFPKPDRKAPDTSKPVKVYILAGQSNTLEMGNVNR